MEPGTVVRYLHNRNFVGVCTGVAGVAGNSHGSFSFHWRNTNPAATDYEGVRQHYTPVADVEIVDEDEAVLLLLAYPELSQYQE